MGTRAAAGRDRSLRADALDLRDRVVLEMPGLPARLVSHGEFLNAMVDLGPSMGREQGLRFDLYCGGKLYPKQDAAFCRSVLAPLREGDGEGVFRAFSALFASHPELLPQPEKIA